MFKKLISLSDRHWICIRRIDMNFYELDSKKEYP